MREQSQREQSPIDDELTALARALRAPVADIARSPAALRVAHAAERAGLFLFDYEQRVQLELPEGWLPLARPDLGVTGLPPSWERGLLGESKYLAFRHDLLLGSLHAGHRAKWTAHELCHGLVGFAWRPDASVFYLALAARAAEALPVALWYFFDEAGLTRCPRHAAQREVGPSFCAACERAAEVAGADEDGTWTARGLAFLERELDAVRQSIASGRPVFTPHGAIDLMTDGLAYASAHAPRLRSPEVASFMALAFSGRGPEHGCFEDLAAFVDHVAALGAYVAGVAPAPATLQLGRDRLIAQDLGARCMQIAADTEGECFAGLSALWAELARAPDAPALERAVAGYDALFEDFELPPPEAVFAVGYPLPRGYGVGRDQLMAGLRSALPATVERLGASLEDELVHFSSAAEPSRAPLGRRFAAFLATREVDAETRGLARLEAAISSATPPDALELALGLDGAMAEVLVLATGVELVRAGFDAGGLLMHGAADPRGPKSFLVRRDASDEVGLVALSEPLAERLALAALDAAEVVRQVETDSELRALLEEGLLVPDRWELTV